MTFKTVTDRPRLVEAIFLAGSFSISRLAFWLIGVRFDIRPLDSFWQYLDTGILQERLISGLFNLHSQPPGFNLFLGLVLKACPNSPSLCFNLFYILLGFALFCSLYYYLRLSDFSKLSAMCCSLIFIVSPSSILYENWLTYTYPIAAMLTVSAVSLKKFRKTGNERYALLFLLMCACVCLTRSAFHLLFLIACISFLFIPKVAKCRGARRIAAYAIVCVCLVSSVYIKNHVVFGFFGSSSWMGMNIMKIVTHAMEKETLDNLAESGKISRIASIGPFNSLSHYTDIIDISSLRYTSNSPELTEKRKTNGKKNLNHMAYIFISRDYHDAANYCIRNYPRAYCSAIFDSWLIYLKPSWSNFFLEQNLSEIYQWIAFLDFYRHAVFVDIQGLKRFLFGQIGSNSIYPLSNLLFLPTILFAACLRSLVCVYRFFRHGNVSGFSFVFMTMTVMYLAILGNALEYGDNNRFRVMTDPMIFLLAVVTFKDLYAYIAKPK